MRPSYLLVITLLALVSLVDSFLAARWWCLSRLRVTDRCVASSPKQRKEKKGKSPKKAK